MLVAVIMAGIVASCSRNSEVDRQFAAANNFMEQHPDSALSILKGIDKELLSSKSEKARYALLMSMALDKNYIDTTSFDVLQPAIDYYIDKGTPDEKLRTYYYQGRIYQNKGDRDQALHSFTLAMDNAKNATDSLCIARTLVAQAAIFDELYDFDTYISNHLRASKIYKQYSYNYYEFDCLLNALNGAIALNDKSLADSIFNVCNLYLPLDEGEQLIFNRFELTYTSKFGDAKALTDISNKLDTVVKNDVDGQINFALVQHKLGNHKRAKQILDRVYESGEQFDTLKHKAILVTVLRDLGDYKKAFSEYCDFTFKIDSIHTLKFDRTVKTIKEKHNLELQVREAERQRAQIIWGSLGIAMLLCIVILVYILHVKRLKIEHTNDLLKIQSLQSNLFERDKQQEEISAKIESLFGTRFKLLDGLASSYFECKETGQEQKRIYAEVKTSLSEFSSEATTQELVDIVNGYKNGLMEHFKADYPKLSASQYRLALYLFCGFSLPSISIFIGTDLRNIYVYKSRLKSIIAKGDTLRKEEYLKYFA